MKAYITKSNGQIHLENLEDTVVVDTDRNSVGITTFESGLPEGAVLISYDLDTLKLDLLNQDPVDYDPEYQKIKEELYYDSASDAMLLKHVVEDWRTFEEAYPGDSA